MKLKAKSRRNAIRKGDKERQEKMPPSQVAK